MVEATRREHSIEDVDRRSPARCVAERVEPREQRIAVVVAFFFVFVFFCFVFVLIQVVHRDRERGSRSDLGGDGAPPALERLGRDRTERRVRQLALQGHDDARPLNDVVEHHAAARARLATSNVALVKLRARADPLGEEPGDAA